MVAVMNVAVTTAAEGFPRRAFTVDDIGRMIDAGIIGEDEKFGARTAGRAHDVCTARLSIRLDGID